MLDEVTKRLRDLVDDWLSRFEQALTRSDQTALSALFLDDSYWRDLLAFTWQIKTAAGRDALCSALLTSAAAAGAAGFGTDLKRTPPRSVIRVGVETIEAIFSFETEQGLGTGVVRLVPDAAAGGMLKAWTFHTSLEALKGYEEHIGRNRPTGKAFSRDFGGPNWLDLSEGGAIL